ncbi:MAG: DUF4097 domain-containing protein, partial [Clostridiales bacterium]|nr:DUF4097 domain-containing protein [Clostridiales bacterium]
RKDWECLGRPALICACPSCMRILGEHLPEIETVSLYETLAGSGAQPYGPYQCQDASQLPPPEGSSVTGEWAVFDPCASSRLPDGTQSLLLRQSVRALAEGMGIKVQPLPVQEHTPRCCGFGGQPECADPGFVQKVREDRAAESGLPYICYCMNCREAFIKAGKPSMHILELRYRGLCDPVAPELSPSARRTNREALRVSLEEPLKNACAATEGGPRPVHTEAGPMPAHTEAGNGICITYADGVMQKMDEGKILAEDVYATVEHARRTGSCFFHPASGVRSGSLMIGQATYWVDYRESGSDGHITATDGRITATDSNITATDGRITATDGHVTATDDRKTATDGHITVTNAYSHRLAIELEDVWGGVRRGDAGKKGTQEGPPSPHLPPAASGPVHEACNAPLVEMEARFSYLGRSFRHKAMRCPVCGLVYIPEGLACGRMRDVEMALEDK